MNIANYVGLGIFVVIYGIQVYNVLATYDSSKQDEENSLYAFIPIGIQVVALVLTIWGSW